MTENQKEGVAMGSGGPRAAKSALGPRALGEFSWSKVPTHNLAYGPARDLARDLRVAVTVWR